MGLYIDYIDKDFKNDRLFEMKLLLQDHKYKLDNPLEFAMEDTNGLHASNNYFFRFTSKPSSFGFYVPLLSLGMSSWPSNCGVCIWHQAQFGNGYYQKLPKALKLAIIEVYKRFVVRMGYSQIHYSAVEENQENLINLLIESGFKKVEGMNFKNKRSGNRLCYLICNV